MWRSRLFWKLFLAYAGLILATAAVIASLVSARQEEQVLGLLRERLHDDAVMLSSQVAEALSSGPPDGLQDVTRSLGRQTGTRMTVIRGDGTVLADSEQDPAVMENHLNRQEIALAAAEGVGVSSHTSRTLGIPMMYLAVRVDHGGSLVGFVRVALPTHSIEERVSAMRRLIWMIAQVVGLATLAVTYWFVARITRPLRALTGAAEAIASGEYGQRVHVPSRDELGRLGEAFNRMSSQLAEHVEQMREDRELLTTMLSGMVEGVIAVDADQRVLFANEAARSMLGMGDPNPAGRPLWEVVRTSAVQEAVQAARERPQPRCRSEFELSGGERRVLALHATRLPGTPSPGTVLVCHDITELRRLENLRREFVANVSHELKTPLASIKAYVETLLGGAINDPENNVVFLRRIDEQAERLHRLILDLLRLARVESGQEVFEITAVPLADVVADCVREHCAAMVKRITLETQPCEPPISVRADEEGVRMILDNLIENATKYTTEGGRVTVRWNARDGVAHLEVEDTGIGIAAEDQARIFERFYRVDKARSRELGGTGLGLSIVKHLVQLLGGRVSVTSQVGRGSTFTVRLPLAGGNSENGGPA
ncbi:MAG: HAMP domain-containing protein [Planctomycetes bacterium]|nr:HAMP domain-containing protein [Planctomycetota bacterium]